MPRIGLSIPTEPDTAFLFLPPVGIQHISVLAKQLLQFAVLRLAAPDFRGNQSMSGRRTNLATRSEGCVTDDRTATLYVDEQDVGIWRFGARKTDPMAPLTVANDVGRHFVADVMR